MIKRLCLIGVGLIGGSIARAAKQQGICAEIVGIDRDKENLKKAKDLSVIDVAVTEIQEGARDCDLVVIATPVGAIERVLFELKSCWVQDIVYTDVGSTKAVVYEALQHVFGDVPSNFVPGHPIAGAEKSGVEASVAGLFRGKRVILTPSANSDRKAVKTVKRFWEDLGATVSTMDPLHHDAVLAATSHLPHILAYALADMLGRKDENSEIFKYAAGGFKDFTRIASSDPAMWLDICMANRGEIANLIQQMIVELDSIDAMLKNKNTEDLYEMFCRANSARKRFLEQYDD